MNIFLAGFSYLEPQCAFTHVSLSSGSFLFSSALHASFLPGYSAKLKRERWAAGSQTSTIVTFLWNCLVLRFPGNMEDCEKNIMLKCYSIWLNCMNYKSIIWQTNCLYISKAYRGSPIYLKITNVVPHFRGFGLCMRKWGIFALVGILLTHNTGFFKVPKSA